jgi:hypothetical protein
VAQIHVFLGNARIASLEELAAKDVDIQFQQEIRLHVIVLKAILMTDQLINVKAVLIHVLLALV